MKILAALILVCVSVPAAADGIAYWPATRERVYIVDANNIGPYGRMTKPRGIDRVVVRVGNKWGTVPSSLYNSQSAGRYRIGR